jgi:hypothetical protein
MDYDQRTRRHKIEMLPTDMAAKLVYEWVKTDHITLREFRELVPRITKLEIVP